MAWQWPHSTPKQITRPIGDGLTAVPPRLVLESRCSARVLQASLASGTGQRVPLYPLPLSADLRQVLLRTFGPAVHRSIQSLLPASGSHCPRLAFPAVLRLLVLIITCACIKLAISYHACRPSVKDRSRFCGHKPGATCGQIRRAAPESVYSAHKSSPKALSWPTNQPQGWSLPTDGCRRCGF